jgi:hypothetical protein
MLHKATGRCSISFHAAGRCWHDDIHLYIPIPSTVVKQWGSLFSHIGKVDNWLCPIFSTFKEYIAGRGGGDGSAGISLLSDPELVNDRAVGDGEIGVGDGDGDGDIGGESEDVEGEGERGEGPAKVRKRLLEISSSLREGKRKSDDISRNLLNDRLRKVRPVRPEIDGTLDSLLCYTKVNTTKGTGRERERERERQGGMDTYTKKQLVEVYKGIDIV